MLYTFKKDLLEVTISDHGAEIKSIKYRGEERLHDSNPAYWGYSAPILFPNVGKLLNDKTIINGKEYTLNRNGFIRDSDFTVINQSDDHIVFSFSANENTLKHYPFLFTMEVEYYVYYGPFGYTIDSTIKITNKSDSIMPFNFGLQPAFKVPISDEYKFEEYNIDFAFPITRKIGKINPDTGIIDFKNSDKEVTNLKLIFLKHEDYKDGALVFDNFTPAIVKLREMSTFSRVILNFEGFTMLGIWTPYPKKAPLICIALLCGCSDTTEDDGIFEHKRHIIKLEPTESYEFHYTLRFR